MAKASKDGSKPKAAKKASSHKGKKNTGGISGPQRILDFVLSMENRTGDPNVPRKMVVAASGVKANTFPVTISGMKKKGLIEYDSSTVCLTEEGRSKANAASQMEVFDNASAQDDLKEQFKIGGKAGLLFDAMRDGRVHDRTTLAESLGITNKATLAVMLSNMRKNGIIEYDRTTIQLSEMNFPMGRPTTNDE